MTGPLVVTITFILAAVGLGTIVDSIFNQKPVLVLMHWLSYWVIVLLVGQDEANRVSINKKWTNKKTHSVEAENASGVNSL